MKKLILNIFLFLILTLTGCLKDSSIVQAISEENNSADILMYLESRGDYINSSSMPSLITSAEIFGNTGDKIILDIRSVSEFTRGHIQNAINIKPADVINYLNTINSNKKIVLVSVTGQSASYYTGLLRLYGYTNIFALKYGMASWNTDFAEAWLSVVQVKTHFNNVFYHKPAITSLPNINFSNSAGNINEKINQRIQELMGLTFSETGISDLSIPSVNLFSIYSLNTEDYLNTFIICYAQSIIYYTLRGPSDLPAHPPSAVFYHASNSNESELRSTNFLQTIPTDKEIVVYSSIGHSSAFITAYLRLLGYKAKSLLFGMHWLFGFNKSEVKNFPYVTGP